MKEYFLILLWLSLPASMMRAGAPSLFPPHPGKACVIVCREAHENIPGNTLAGSRCALDRRCDFMEIDMRRTCAAPFFGVHDDRIDNHAPGHQGRANEKNIARGTKKVCPAVLIRFFESRRAAAIPLHHTRHKPTDTNEQEPQKKTDP